MAKQTLNLGAIANDGTGSNLRAGGTIINANFNEIYTALGNGTTITLTATPTELNLLAGATSIVTSNNSLALSNKTISGSNNTLSNIGNSSLTNSSFSIRDDSSSAISISLGGTLKLKSNDGITTTVSQGDTITIGLDSNIVTETSTDTLTNKTLTSPTLTSPKIDLINDANGNEILSFSTITSSTDYLVIKNGIGVGTPLHILAEGDSANIGVHLQPKGTGIFTISDGTDFNKGIRFRSSSSAASTITLIDAVSTAGRVVTLPDATDTLVGRATSDTLTNKIISGSSNTLSNIANGSLTNSSITLGSTSTSLGGTTTSIAGLSLTGSSNTIDLTSSGNKLRFNFVNVAGFPNATTYQGLFAVATGTAKAYFADSGAYNEILSENSSIKDLADVAATSPTNGQVLIFNSTTGRYEPGAQGAGGTVTSVATGTGLTGGPITSTGTILVDTSSIFQGAATIDVTASGASAYLFNSHYSGNNPTLYLRAGHTYAFNLQQGGSHPFFLQTVSGGYSAGNAYSTGLTHVTTAGTVTTGAVGAQSSGVLYIEVPSGSSSTIYYVCQNHSSMAGKIVLGSITDTFTGDGSTVAFTINSGRNVNDVLAIVNGIILVPTTDYTISTTTLTFVTAPAASAEIQVRYL